jgi:5'-nucleotidase
LRILVTNDDGVDAPGLWAVVRELSDLGEVAIVAPDRDQSGMGTARTLLNVLRVNEVESRVDGVPAYSVSGTPGDCVILGAEVLFSHAFDLVVSGINEGANLGMDVLDSGTVGGALRGFFRKIPSIAVSVTSVTGVRYESAARVARVLAAEVVNGAGSRPVMYNVNVPNLPGDQLKGVKATFLGPKAFLESVVRSHDGRRTHYWIRHNMPTDSEVPVGCDLWATRNGWVSITPMDTGFVAGEGLRDFSTLADVVAKGLGLGADR